MPCHCIEPTFYQYALVRNRRYMIIVKRNMYSGIKAMMPCQLCLHRHIAKSTGIHRNSHMKCCTPTGMHIVTAVSIRLFSLFPWLVCIGI